MEEGTFSIGRGSDNDLSLSDPELHLSKKHCVINSVDGQYVITDISTNGVYLNGSGQPLGNGGSAVLRDGDRLSLGDYGVVVEVRSNAARSPVANAWPTGGRGSTPFGEIDAFGRPEGMDSSSSSSDPWASGGQGGTPFGGRDLLYGANSSNDVSSLAPSGNQWSLDDQRNVPFDASALLGGAQNPENAPGPRQWHDAFPPTREPRSTPVDQGLLQNAPAIHDYLASRQDVGSDPALTTDPTPMPPIDIPEDLDFLKEPEASKPHPLIKALRKGANPQGAPEAVEQPAPQPNDSPRAVPENPPPAPPAPMPASLVPSNSSQDGAMWREFLAAAGLDPVAFGSENPVDLTRALGRVFREMVAGLKELLATRDQIKSEYRVERTVVQAIDNNPLKFSVDTAQAAAALLMRAQPGYLVGAKAVNQAFKDLKAHEIAYMVGMQAALMTLLNEFDPDGLKARLDKQKGWDSLIFGSQAKYWGAFEEHYREIASDISENARSVFGLAFAKAYEEQLKKL